MSQYQNEYYTLTNDELFDVIDECYNIPLDSPCTYAISMLLGMDDLAEGRAPPQVNRALFALRELHDTLYNQEKELSVSLVVDAYSEPIITLENAVLSVDFIFSSTDSDFMEIRHKLETYTHPLTEENIAWISDKFLKGSD